MKDVTHISTGFLSGNLDLEHADDDERYAEALRLALQDAYPGVSIRVPYQRNAEGSLPSPLRTMVTRGADGYWDTDDDEVPIIDDIAARVYEDGTWRTVA